MNLLRAVLVVALAAVVAAAAQSPDPREIVRRSVERDQMNWNLARDYTFVQRVQENRRDRRGNLTKTEIRTSEILIMDRKFFERLIAKDDKPLTDKEKEKADREFEKELAKWRGKNERERANALADQEKERREAREFLLEVPEAYEFTLAGEESLAGRATWLIDAVPKSGYRPKSKRGQWLPKMKGRLWVDQAEFQWVKAEIETVATISFGFILARLAKGAHLGFEQTKVNNEIWLPQHAAVTAEARIGLVKRLSADVDVRYSGYRKFQSNSRITGVEELPPGASGPP
jgi:hypothetical protein